MVLLAIHTKATKHHFFWLHFGGKKIHFRHIILYTGRLNMKLFTFRGIVHEESLKQLMLNGDLISGVIRKNIFMTNIIKTCEKRKRGE